MLAWKKDIAIGVMLTFCAFLGCYFQYPELAYTSVGALSGYVLKNGYKAVK